MTTKRANAWRKVAAVLAGGLVLGVGAATTMASWTDSQEATATFTAGEFKLESNPNETVWADHDSSDGAKIIVDTAGMSPGVSSFGHLDVRTTTVSTLGGKITLQAAVPSAGSNAAMVSALEFRANVIGANGICDKDAFTGVNFVKDVTGSPSVPEQNLSAGATNFVRYCLQVRMEDAAPDAVQGKSASLTWTIQGTST